MNAELPVIPISSAIAFKDFELEADVVKVHESKEYKYLTAMPIFEDGSYAAMCSKDMDEWLICAGATDANGNHIDVRKLAMKVKKCVEEQKGR